MIRLILVEDENISRRGLVENVDWAGNGVELAGVAENGMEAYWMAQEFVPDIIVTDIRMPVMDGLELIRRLREEMPSIRFIIISAHQEFVYAQQAIQYGVDNYIIKPVNDHELIENVLAVYRKSENIRKEMFQKNFDYLLLKNDCFFIQRYQNLEDQLVNSFRLLQINEVIKLTGDIYEMLTGGNNQQYYRFVCIHQFVRFRELLVSMNKADVFIGVDSMIENELLRLPGNEEILTWYRQKLREYANMLAIDTQPRVKHVVEKTEEYIRCNYMCNITLHDVSAQVFVSPQYLSRIFHSEKGVSFIEYLNLYRIDKAKELLRQQDMSITEVAAQAGYNDYKYFSNVFKRYTGITPRDFRKNTS
jgi:two-component system response regulator YesN